MLLHITDIYTNGFSPNILDVFSLAAIFFGVLVIITKSPVISILYLIALFGSISIYLFTIDLVFLALAYLLVYVGAVSILFLFILMLIDVRISELYSGTSNSTPLAILIGVFFIYPINQLLPHGTVNLDKAIESIYATLLYIVNGLGTISKDMSYVTSALWDGYLTQTSHISSIGNIMFTSYAIWIILTSLILLLAMVGAIVITIKQNNSTYYSRVLDPEYVVQLTQKSVQYLQLFLIFLGICGSNFEIINFSSFFDTYNNICFANFTEGILSMSEPIPGPTPLPTPTSGDVVIEITITTGPRLPNELFGPDGKSGPMIIFPGPSLTSTEQ